MPVKMTGVQYKAFLASDWGPDAMWQETEILRNGLLVDEDSDSAPDECADGDIITIVAGTIIPDQNAPATSQEYIDAVRFARKWLKAQNTVTLLVDVPREHAEWFQRQIANYGFNGTFPKVTMVNP